MILEYDDDFGSSSTTAMRSGDFRPAFPTRRSSDLTRQPLSSLQRSTRPRSPPTATEPSRSTTAHQASRSEEHTSELQSLTNLVCRLLLEKKNDRGWRCEQLVRGTGSRR